MPKRHPLILGTILVVMVWFAAVSDDWRYAYPLQGQKSDYYNLLVDGLLEGHLHMKAEVHPGVETRDPLVLARTPYLLDASYYQGRYYLYFGVVPAVLVFLPYAWLTGHDLPMNAAVLLLVFGGFLVQYRVFVSARRRHFPALSPALETVAMLLLAFGAVTMILVKGSGMYEVAIAGGYFFVSLVWLGVFQALHQPDRSLRWLLLASLSAGLAVGCRPTLGAVLPFLALATLWIALRQGRSAAGWVRLAGAAVIPAGLIGLALMAYNYARFDDPFEFGFRHTLSALVLDGFPIAKASFMLPNLRWYYLLPPVWSPHFPWVEPLDAQVRPSGYYGYEAIYGQALMAWLAAVTLLGVVLLRRRGVRLVPPLAVWLTLGAAAFLTLLLALSVFGFRADRYVVDFQGTLALVVAVAGGAVVAALPASAQARLWRAAWCALAVLVVGFNLLISLDHMHHFEYVRSKSFKPLAYVANYPAYVMSRLGLVKYGPVRFTAEFGREVDDRPRPLFGTGNAREPDVWYVRHLGQGQYDLTLVHHGYGQESVRVQLEPGRPFDVELSMGSLFPPRWHPYFRGWTAEAIERAKTSASLRLDGELVMNARMRFYDASPWRVRLGESSVDGENRWRGSLSPPKRQPVDPVAFEAPPVPLSGFWQFEIERNPVTAGVAQPVLSSGIAGAGNLLAMLVLPDDAVEFRYDQWGSGMSQSGPVPMPPGRRVVEVLVGPPAAASFTELEPADRARLEAVKDRVLVWVDGRLVWETPIRLNEASYASVGLGTNHQGFSTAAASFHGEFRLVELTPAQERALLEQRLRELPVPDAP